jgi:hypothetical protein
MLLFSAEDWGAFIEEWVHYQRTQYLLVTRLFGSKDMGIDVAGFTDDGFQGAWDNYQCTHYGGPVTASPPGVQTHGQDEGPESGVFR